MKGVLISIQPKWCELIASGKKTIEVRKTRPKLETPFKCYIYCTIGNGAKGDYLIPSGIQCGKVIGEFVCDRIDAYDYDQAFDESMGVYLNSFGYAIMSGDLEQTCLSYEEFEKYGNTYPLYGWHISNLKIYDKAKELGEFKKAYPIKCGKGYESIDCTGCGSEFTCSKRFIKRPFQGWGYIEV